jgi:hypothetical protein
MQEEFTAENAESAEKSKNKVEMIHHAFSIPFFAFVSLRALCVLCGEFDWIRTGVPA